MAARDFSAARQGSGRLVVYFAIVFAGGYAIRYLTRPLTRHLPSNRRRINAELAQRGHVHRLAGAEPCSDGEDSAFAGDDAPGACSEIDCVIFLSWASQNALQNIY